MVTTLSRRTAVCQSAEELWLTGVVFSGVVSQRSNLYGVYILGLAYKILEDNCYKQHHHWLHISSMILDLLKEPFPRITILCHHSPGPFCQVLIKTRCFYYFPSGFVL